MIPTPSGAKLIVYRSGTRATDRLDVYDFGADVWQEVERPAITAWEYARP